MAGNGNNGKVTHELNYVTSNRFYVEIDSSIAASFTECTGLSVQIKKNVFQEGGVNDQQRIYLGHTEFADITLKRGVTDHPGFWNWINAVFDEQKRTSRRNVNILIFNQSGETMMSWTLIGAIPVTWKTPTLQADGKAVAIEELTLAYEGLKVARTSGGGNSVERNEKTGYFVSS
ncbi:phage tail protein [Nostoc linckia z18]|jgi:phage tail-like protein|uniref:Phage tail protein n=3 Tax=Nostoc TaxID=1177 RepID=A0A9Q5ZB38_NOSLI|nr:MULTISPECIES: phage tail protein [Nostoc]MBL1203235.1 phage tail protein [Nostoc sp. GBBB01]MDZ8012600.1 phage tail protein [Nostoc sp. ZfuVER08]PHK42128.1 phage tail protein [Nostoc linckia z15]PHK44079.1 phage tail protein [Nostoc linckia z16]MBD2611447.1 phage tail protein [Nostoc punctiforme FACHB-252]